MCPIHAILYEANASMLQSMVAYCPQIDNCNFNGIMQEWQEWSLKCLLCGCISEVFCELAETFLAHRSLHPQCAVELIGVVIFRGHLL